MFIELPVPVTGVIGRGVLWNELLLPGVETVGVNPDNDAVSYFIPRLETACPLD